jgi:hypothetical protein
MTIHLQAKQNNNLDIQKEVISEKTGIIGLIVMERNGNEKMV